MIHTKAICESESTYYEQWLKRHLFSQDSFPQNEWECRP